MIPALAPDRSTAGRSKGANGATSQAFDRAVVRRIVQIRLDGSMKDISILEIRKPGLNQPQHDTKDHRR